MGPLQGRGFYIFYSHFLTIYIIPCQFSPLIDSDSTRVALRPWDPGSIDWLHPGLLAEFRALRDHRPLRPLADLGRLESFGWGPWEDKEDKSNPGKMVINQGFMIFYNVLLIFFKGLTRIRLWYSVTESVGFFLALNMLDYHPILGWMVSSCESLHFSVFAAMGARAFDFFWPFSSGGLGPAQIRLQCDRAIWPRVSWGAGWPEVPRSSLSWLVWGFQPSLLNIEIAVFLWMIMDVHLPQWLVLTPETGTYPATCGSYHWYHQWLTGFWIFLANLTCEILWV